MSSTGPQPSFEDTRSKILLVKEKINKEVRIERPSQIYKACEYLLDNYEAMKSQIDKILSLPSDVTSKNIGELQVMVENEDDDVKDAMDSIWLFKTTYIVRAADQITSIRDDLIKVLQLKARITKNNVFSRITDVSCTANRNQR